MEAADSLNVLNIVFTANYFAVNFFLYKNRRQCKQNCVFQ